MGEPFMQWNHKEKKKSLTGFGKGSVFLLCKAQIQLSFRTDQMQRNYSVSLQFLVLPSSSPAKFTELSSKGKVHWLRNGKCLYEAPLLYLTIQGSSAVHTISPSVWFKHTWGLFQCHIGHADSSFHYQFKTSLRWTIYRVGPKRAQPANPRRPPSPPQTSMLWDSSNVCAEVQRERLFKVSVFSSQYFCSF